MTGIEVRVEAVILSPSNEILVVLHRKKGKSYWVLPGGHLEPGEKLSSCLARELNEELFFSNIRVKELVFVDEFIEEGRSRHIVKIGFMVDISAEELRSVRVKAVDESIADARFYSRDDISASKDQFYPSKDFFLEILQYKYPG